MCAYSESQLNLGSVPIALSTQSFLFFLMVKTRDYVLKNPTELLIILKTYIMKIRIFQSINNLKSMSFILEYFKAGIV